MKWWPSLRLLTRTVRALESIAQSQRRIADFYEGVTPAQPLPEEPPDREPLDAFYRNDAEIARAYALEEDLGRQLGRPPTVDELVHALDDVEWTAEDAAAQRAKVLRDLAEAAAATTARPR